MDDHPWMIIMITSVAVRIAKGGSKGGGSRGGAGLRWTRFARLASLDSLRSTRFARMRYFNFANGSDAEAFGSGAEVTAPARRLQVSCALWSQPVSDDRNKKYQSLRDLFFCC